MKKSTLFLVLITALAMIGWNYSSNDGNSDKDVIGDVNINNVVFDQDIQYISGYNSDNPLAVLYTQNELVSHPGQGLGGADVSAITTPGTLFGFGSQGNLFNWMGDDFTIPAGQTWKIDSIKFYSYQTGSTLTSTLTASHVRVWRGRVDSVGAVVVGGDTSTNRMSATYWSNIYRTTGTPPYNNQSTRPIMSVVDTLNLTLTGGYYWLEFTFRGSLASGPWAPPRTILGTPATGNGKQRLGGVWGNAMDGANQQGLPFVIYGSILTGITNNNNGTPVSYNLKQNYPNPFNPSTKISFDLPKQDFVKIAVFDMSGREVETIVNQVVDAGSFTVDFNASKLSTGVYFYKMITSEFATTKKMILIK